MGPDVGLVYFSHTSAFSYHDTIPESLPRFLGIWKKKPQIISDILGSSFSADQNTRWEQEPRFKSHISHLLLITAIPSAKECSEPHSLYLQNKDLLLFSCFKSCPTLCDPTHCSTPGSPVLHHLLELAQTHVRWVGEAIQLSRPLSSPSPPAFDPS